MSLLKKFLSKIFSIFTGKKKKNVVCVYVNHVYYNNEDVMNALDKDLKNVFRETDYDIIYVPDNVVIKINSIN